MVISFGLKFFVYLGVVALVTANVILDDGSGDEPEHEWDENPDYVASPEKKCPAEDEIRDVKRELKNLRASIEGLRSHLDPEFKGEPDIDNSVSTKCPNGFHYLPKAGSCYRVIYEEHNWTSADDRCRQMTPDAHLVAIATKEENEALKRYLTWDLNANSRRNVCIFHDWGDKEKMLWTAGHKRNNDCQEPFVWKLSPTQEQLLSFNQWAVNEPNCWNETEKCVHMRQSNEYKWNDLNCERKMCPVCEFDPPKN